jgi:hypothetical protein
MLSYANVMRTALLAYKRNTNIMKEDMLVVVVSMLRMDSLVY